MLLSNPPSSQNCIFKQGREKQLILIWKILQLATSWLWQHGVGWKEILSSTSGSVLLTWLIHCCQEITLTWIFRTWHDISICDLRWNNRHHSSCCEKWGIKDRKRGGPWQLSLASLTTKKQCGRDKQATSWGRQDNKLILHILCQPFFTLTLYYSCYLGSLDKTLGWLAKILAMRDKQASRIQGDTSYPWEVNPPRPFFLLIFK